MKPDRILRRVRRLRREQTKAERTLWAVLRGKQLCGLKFRRQFPVGEFIADFACPAHWLIVELDGGYHDYVDQEDLEREASLANAGWRVIRFTNEDVLTDVEPVLKAITQNLGLPYHFRKRNGNVAGNDSKFHPTE